MSSRCMSLLPRTTLHSDSKHKVPISLYSSPTYKHLTKTGCCTAIFVLIKNQHELIFFIKINLQSKFKSLNIFQIILYFILYFYSLLNSVTKRIMTKLTMTRGITSKRIKDTMYNYKTSKDKMYNVTKHLRS